MDQPSRRLGFALHCFKSVHETVVICVKSRIEDEIGRATIHSKKPSEMFRLQSERACARRKGEERRCRRVTHGAQQQQKTCTAIS